MNLALTGDIMLGRQVDQCMIQNSSVQPASLWGDVISLLGAADRRLANLECVISTRGEAWHPTTKAFHFRAHPRAIEFLRAGRIDGVALANNHVLDYGDQALVDCLSLLTQAGIRHAGAGRNLREALTPAVLESRQGRLAVVALTDNEPEWEATEMKAGVNHVTYTTHGLAEPYRSRMTRVISEARRQAQFVVVSAHVGPNWGEPSRAMRALAHELLDFGADLYWGHSNHTPQGIEVYKHKVILYSTGDFVDDYAIDPGERNDLSFLFLLELDQNRVARVRLHPVAIKNHRVQLAKGSEMIFLMERMRARCAAFDSRIEFQKGVGTMAVG